MVARCAVSASGEAHMRAAARTLAATAWRRSLEKGEPDMPRTANAAFMPVRNHTSMRFTLNELAIHVARIVGSGNCNSKHAALPAARRRRPIDRKIRDTMRVPMKETTVSHTSTALIRSGTRWKTGNEQQNREAR